MQSTPSARLQGSAADVRAKNIRTGLTLLSIAVVFGVGFFANRMLFG